MDYEFSTPHTIANIVAILTAILAMRWATAARVLLGAIFIGAAVVNSNFAIIGSQIYLGYGELTASELYRSIILE